MRRRRLYNSNPAQARPAARTNGLSRPWLRLATLVLVALSIWLLSTFVGQVVTSSQMDRRTLELQTQVGQIQATSTALANQAAYVTSPDYAEKVAREQFGMAREGDIVVVPNVPLPTPVVAPSPPVPLPELEQQPNWRSWIAAFQP